MQIWINCGSCQWCRLIVKLHICHGRICIWRASRPTRTLLTEPPCPLAALVDVKNGLSVRCSPPRRARGSMPPGAHAEAPDELCWPGCRLVLRIGTVSAALPYCCMYGFPCWPCCWLLPGLALIRHRLRSPSEAPTPAQPSRWRTRLAGPIFPHPQVWVQDNWNHQPGSLPSYIPSTSITFIICYNL